MFTYFAHTHFASTPLPPPKTHLPPPRVCSPSSPGIPPVQNLRLFISLARPPSVLHVQLPSVIGLTVPPPPKKGG